MSSVRSETNHNGRIQTQQEVMKELYRQNDGTRSKPRLKPLGSMNPMQPTPTPKPVTTQITGDKTTAAQLSETVLAKRLREAQRRDLSRRNISHTNP